MRQLTIDQLLSELDHRPGLIPAEFDDAGRKLRWIDFETYHPYEGFFHRAVGRFATLKQATRAASVAWFVTDTDVLRDSRILTKSISPTGFIFHAGRCGSTLLTRILARDRRHLVFGEAAAHNQAWLALAENGAIALTPTEADKQFYKNLILAMGRKRLPEHEAHFVKFTSFNILFFNFIHSVFPDVPALFLYREPLDILDSYAKKSPGWFAANQEPFRMLLAGGTPVGHERENLFDSPATTVAAFFSAGLLAGEKGVKYVNYIDLNPSNLPAILSALNVHMTMKQLKTMEAQFGFDSKLDQRATQFVATAKVQNTRSLTESSAELNELYNQLLQSERNVVARQLVGSSRTR